MDTTTDTNNMPSCLKCNTPMTDGVCATCDTKTEETTTSEDTSTEEKTTEETTPSASETPQG